MARVINNNPHDQYDHWDQEARQAHHSAIAHTIVQWLFMMGLAGSLALGVFTELLFGHILAPIWP
jgi:hypothetical protein